MIFERRIDKMGRVVIPRDIRRLLSLLADDVLLLSIEGGVLTVRKKMPMKRTKA